MDSESFIHETKLSSGSHLDNFFRKCGPLLNQFKKGMSLLSLRYDYKSQYDR